MESSTRYGLVAVFAVSGGMVFLAHRLHKRLLSDFIKKFEFEIRGNSEKRQGKKKVRFAEKVIEFPLEKGYTERNASRARELQSREWGVKEMKVQKWRAATHKLEDIMPPNRAVLYRGIIKQRTLNAKLRF